MSLDLLPRRRPRARDAARHHFGPALQNTQTTRLGPAERAGLGSGSCWAQTPASGPRAMVAEPLIRCFGRCGVQRILRVIVIARLRTQDRKCKMSARGTARAHLADVDRAVDRHASDAREIAHVRLTYTNSPAFAILTAPSVELLGSGPALQNTRTTRPESAERTWLGSGSCWARAPVSGPQAMVAEP